MFSTNYDIYISSNEAEKCHVYVFLTDQLAIFYRIDNNKRQKSTVKKSCWLFMKALVEKKN